MIASMTCPAYQAPVTEDLDCQLMDAVMPAGTALNFSGTLWHRGGGNRSEANRLAITLQYLRALGPAAENMFLAVPEGIT